MSTPLTPCVPPPVTSSVSVVPTPPGTLVQWVGVQSVPTVPVRPSTPPGVDLPRSGLTPEWTCPGTPETVASVGAPAPSVSPEATTIGTTTLL